MFEFSIPTCYFPTTALFLDDNRDFLLNFVLQLDESLAYRLFDNPIKALQHLENQPLATGIINERIKPIDLTIDGKIGKLCTYPELSPIYGQLSNPNRFAEISVIVVDYAMPGMDGLAFCRKIDSTIKKILLTGQADEHLAIAAFNEGLIHRYIKKSDANASELVTKSIQELQYLYFSSASIGKERHFSFMYPDFLQDKVFSHFFHRFIAEKHMVEYYLIDTAGSFLLLDEEATPGLLIVRTEEDLCAFVAMAQEVGIEPKAIQPILRREVIPAVSRHYLSEENINACMKTLLPAAKVTGTNRYYYSYVQRDIFLDAHLPKILSYRRYLDDVDIEELSLE